MSKSIFTRSRNRSRAILLLGALLTIAACGGGGGTGDSSTTTSLAAGGTAGPPATSASFTVRDLVGSWDNGVYLLTVSDGSQYVLAASDAPDAALMEGFVAAMGTTISFATGSSGECPAQTGNYKAALNGDTLTFTVSNDPCETRVAGFAEPFTRTG